MMNPQQMNMYQGMVQQQGQPRFQGTLYRPMTRPMRVPHHSQQSNQQMYPSPTSGQQMMQMQGGQPYGMMQQFVPQQVDYNQVPVGSPQMQYRPTTSYNNMNPQMNVPAYSPTMAQALPFVPQGQPPHVMYIPRPQMQQGMGGSLLGKKKPILGDTRKQFESERQLHEDTRTQFESERQLHEDTRRQFESERQLNEGTHGQLENERQQHADTRGQLENEQQLHTDTRGQLESEQQEHADTRGQLECEQQEHADTRGQLESEQQLHADTRGQLESEQHQHADTRGQLENEQQRHADTRGQLESNQLEHADTINEKHDLERRLEEAQHRITELESTLTTAQRALETHHNSSEATDWVLERQEIELTDKVIGIGGWANVVEGKFRGMIVAVKQIHELILSPHNRRLFEREMNIAARCRHPCLLQFIGATNDDNSPLFVTELLDTSLRNVLHERELEPNEVTTLSLDVARALNYLHLNHPTPIIHRDISSANVLLWKHRDSWRAKVSDYGTANFMHYSMTISPGAVVYSAPEAQTSRQSPKVDVYSFGVLLCEMNTREFPDAMCRTEQVTMVTNHDFRDLIRRCLLEDPQERPSMNDIINKLETFNFEK